MLFTNCHLEQYFFKIKLFQQKVQMNMTYTVLETKVKFFRKMKKNNFDRCKF